MTKKRDAEEVGYKSMPQKIEKILEDRKTAGKFDESGFPNPDSWDNRGGEGGVLPWRIQSRPSRLMGEGMANESGHGAGEGDGFGTFPVPGFPSCARGAGGGHRDGVGYLKGDGDSDGYGDPDKERLYIPYESPPRNH